MILHGIEAKGRFGKQDFVYLSDEDVYRCPAGEMLAYPKSQSVPWPGYDFGPEVF